MRFFILFLIFLMTSFLDVNAQGSIAGEITNASGKPIPGITVKATPGEKGTVTNNKGFYVIMDLPKGLYKIFVSGVGYKDANMVIELEDQQEVKLDVVLNEDMEQLQTVEVTGRKERSYVNTNSFSGTKTMTALRHTPQAISYVTKEVIEDQQAFKTSDVVKNLSNVNVFSFYNNDFSIRGFRAGNALINGLRNPTSSWSQSLLPNVERIEVIKGPASALFANSDPGGTVNTVTKKPLDESRKSVSFSTGSFNTFRIASDFTGPMNNEKTLLYRLNLAYQNAESFRVLQGGEDMVIAPSISFIPTEKTKVNFDFVYSKSKSKLDRGQPIFGATAGTDLNSTPISFAIGKKNDYLNELNLYTTVSLEQKLTKTLSFNASYMKFMYEENLLEHRTSNNYAVDADGNQIPTLIGMSTIRRQRGNCNDNLTMYLVKDWVTGSVEHKILAGYDYIQNISPEGGSSYNATGYRNAENNGFIATFNPAKKEKYLIVDNMPVPNVPHFNLKNPDYSISEISGYFNVSSPQPVTKYYVSGFYLQDQISWGKIKVLLSLRQEYYNDILNYKKKNSKTVQQKALIPRIGLVYTPADFVSIYANYSQGYQPQGASKIGDPARFGGPFDPLTSTMYEAGSKMEFFRKQLSINTAFYQIELNNILINANEPGNPDKLRQLGQQRARGIELDVNGQITRNLRLTANMAYSKAIITKSQNENEIGTLLPNAPKTQGGVWAKYIFDQTFLKGLGLGIGCNFVGKRVSLKSSLKLPSYVVADAALYYAIDKFRISANLNNVFNKTHWTGGYDYSRLFPGTPRNFLIGIGYSF